MDLLLDFLLISGILFTCFVLFLLVKRKEKDSSKKVLIVIFVLVLLIFINSYSFLHHIKTLFVLTFLFNSTADVFIGSILLVYIRSITGDSKNWIKKNGVHFIFPVLYLFLVSVPLLISFIDETYDVAYLLKLDRFFMFAIGYSLIYCALALKNLEKHVNKVKQNYSNLQNKDLGWVRYLLVGTMIIIAIDLISTVYELTFEDIGRKGNFISIIPIVFLVAYLGYYGISQSKILLPDFLLDDTVKESELSIKTDDVNRNKYMYDEDQMKQLEMRLVTIMQKDKPYLNEDLTLSMLSDLLDVSDKRLSTLMNQRMNTSFYDYINGFRVKEVKKALESETAEKYNLLGIAYDCGFKSKSSFNRIFKNLTKMSPSEYRRKTLL